MDDHVREFDAKTVDEAIILAMRSFHAEFEDLEITVLSEGSKGFLGMGGKNARIRARLKTAGMTPPPGEHREAAAGGAPEEGRAETPGTQSAKTPGQADEEFLQRARGITSSILDLMGIHAETKIRPDGVVEIVGDGSGIIIGKHGQTLDALQFLVNRILNKAGENQVHVTLDTEGYRQRHIDHLRSLALKMGQKARKTGQPVTLEKMNPYDRRIIHLALRDEKGLDTRSIGEGLYKKVVIVPKRASRRF